MKQERQDEKNRLMHVRRDVFQSVQKMMRPQNMREATAVIREAV